MDCTALKISLVFRKAVTEIQNRKTWHVFSTQKNNNLGDKTLLMMIKFNESLVSKCVIDFIMQRFYTIAELGWAFNSLLPRKRICSVGTWYISISHLYSPILMISLCSRPVKLKCNVKSLTAPQREWMWKVWLRLPRGILSANGYILRWQNWH